MFGQTFHANDLFLIALLVVLEGVLSIDNALVLGLLAKRLPQRQQRRALTYGLIGAFLFRLLAIGAAAWLLRWRIVKLLGGGYLLWVAIKHFFFERRTQTEEQIAVDADCTPMLVHESDGSALTGSQGEEELQKRRPVPIPRRERAAFWNTVVAIELTDIAFAVDSIVAAIALVGSAPAGHVGVHPKLWVVLTGGMLGVILMRFAAVLFIKLLNRFPSFETAAYLLVNLIGLKLLLDWRFNTAEHPHRLNFHSPESAAFWVFWVLMVLCFSTGFFLPRKKAKAAVVGTEL